MKFTLLTTATLLTLTLTPLSVLANTNTTVLRKCIPLLGDAGEQEAWFVANLECNADCQKNGFNGGGCNEAVYECICS